MVVYLRQPQIRRRLQKRVRPLAESCQGRKYRELRTIGQRAKPFLDHHSRILAIVLLFRVGLRMCIEMVPYPYFVLLGVLIVLLRVISYHFLWV